MNILIIGTSTQEQALIELCRKSRFLDKIYTASFNPLKDVPNIEYKDFKELAQKSKALQIDITIVINKEIIENGICEIFRKNLLNIICVNKKWFNLESSNLIAKQLSSHYSINIPTILKAPLSFPVVIRTDKTNEVKIAHTMNELIKIKENFTDYNCFLEEYLSGEIFDCLFLWDSKNLIDFIDKNKFTEVQLDRFELLKTKLCFMLSDEKADFISFFTIKTIWAKNDWYVLNYSMRIDNDINLKNIKDDFLYILNAAIYQKLNEINK